LRRTVFALRELSVPVTACGYRNSASAEPMNSVAYAVCASVVPGISDPGLGS
jgi:hypothetical protein